PQGKVAAEKLLDDGFISLFRQWVLRSEFWGRPVNAHAQSTGDGVPLFYSFDNFKPRAGALVHGAVLSIVIFWAVCLAMRYGWNHTVKIPFVSIQYENSSRVVTSSRSEIGLTSTARAIEAFAFSQSET